MKKTFFQVLAAMATATSMMVLTGCEPGSEVVSAGYLGGKIETLDEAKAYFERQLAGGVMVKSSARLTDETPGGWRLEFTGGAPATIDLMNGSDAVTGLTPKLVVRHNADGSTSLWVEENDRLVETRVGLTGPFTTPVIPGKTGIPPKLDVRRDDDGTLTVWFNDLYNYPDEGWKDTGVKLRAGSGKGSVAEQGPIRAIIDNEARGIIGIWLNDEEHTLYTFGKFSPAYRFNLMSNHLDIREGEKGTVELLVSSSRAWIPTGASEWIERWELNCAHAEDTRTGYVHECEYFDIESILPSGKGEGSYTVTIRNNRANLNVIEGGEEHGLVLNTNTENVPMLITSTRLTLGQKLPPSANSIIMKPNSSVDINMVQVIKEYQAGHVSAMRIKQGDNVTADWVWSCKPGMETPTGVVSAVDVITAPSSGLNTEIRVTAGSTEGNAVVAAKVNDVIVWSWHIWVTDYDPESNPLHFQSTGVSRLEAPDAGKDHIFMDRNMGALDNKPGDDPRKAFGLFYQWGRKDPFAGNWSLENTVEGRAIIYTRSNPQGEPQPIKYLMMTAGVRYSIENPQDFISMQNAMTGAWSWNDMSMEALARLWYDGTDVSSHVTKSVYDPCPAGWRMPARGVLEGFQADEDKAVIRANKGHVKTPFGYVPYAGYVDKDGVMHHDEGVYAFYTSQADVPIWFSRWADGVRYETTGGSKTTMNAANTYSVRCQKED